MARPLDKLLRPRRGSFTWRRLAVGLAVEWMRWTLAVLSGVVPFILVMFLTAPVLGKLAVLPSAVVALVAWVLTILWMDSRPDE